MLGKIKFVNLEKQYAIISVDSGGEAFVAPSEFKGCRISLQKGDAVEFSTESNPRRPDGLLAKNLRAPLPEFLW